MKQLLVLLLVLFSINFARSAGYESITDHQLVFVESSDWCYDESSCNESTWKDLCKRKTTTTLQQWEFSQSPVNINTSRLDNTYLINCLNHKSLKGPFKLQFRKYTIQIELENTVYFGEFLINKYNFHGLHFHWGNKDDVGSEHTINGRSFPLEIHLVCYWQSAKDMDDALRTHSYNSVLVVAVLVDIIPLKSGFAGSQVLAPIIKRLSATDPTANGQEELDLADLFQSDRVYYYSGTLTSPPCDRVPWLIMQRPLLIPKEHLDAIRLFANANGIPHIKGNNFRSLKSRFQLRPNGSTTESFVSKIDLVKCKTDSCEGVNACLEQQQT